LKTGKKNHNWSPLKSLGTETEGSS
jgi:hypothetical protein